MEEKQISVVEQIHNEFENASDLILAEANGILNNAVTKDGIMGRKLSELGFINAKKAKIFSEEKTRIELTQKQVEVVSYHKRNYPHYKFIFKDSVQEICKVYGLVCAEAKCYTGDVPEKNMLEIEQFEKIRQNIRFKTFSVPKENYNNGKIEDDGGRDAREYPSLYSAERVYSHKGIIMASYMICAPLADMDLSRTEKLGNGYVYDREKPVPDPVVLCPVHNDGYLIVTKWGNEENIEELKQ